MKIRTRVWAFIALIALPCFNLLAADKVWVGGASNLWHVAANWSPSGIPAASDNVMVTNGFIQYVPGGDLVRNTGTTMTMGQGGTFVQTGGIAWMAINGNLVLNNGAVFDTGTAGAFNIGSAGSVTINEGSTFRRLGNTLVVDSKWIFNGGTVDNGLSEFQFNTEVDFDAILYTGMLAPQNTAGILNLKGGHLYLRGTGWDSFYRVGSAYLNFPIGSDGIITITNCTTGVVYSRYFSGATPKMRYDDEVVSSGDFASLFVVEASSSMPNAVDLYLVPQETAGAATFVESSCVKSNLTATSATFYATISDAGNPDAEVFACYGLNNGAAIFANWQNKVSLGTAVAGSSYQYTASLASNTLYYYRLAATNSSGISFATPTPTFFITGQVGVQSPSSVAENSPTPVSIIVSRPSTNNCKDMALSVPFTVGGTATLGTHYTLSTTSPAIIPSGASSTTVSLLPKPDWTGNTERTVTFTLGSSPSYLLADSNTVSILLVDAVFPSAPTNAFLGKVSESSLDPENWSLGVVPTAGHIVVFSPEYAQNQLDWVVGSPSTVAAWMQPYAFPTADYRVLFHTTPSEPLTITGDCLLNGGYWVHEGPSNSPVCAVAVNIGGNLTIGSGAQINAGNGGVNQVNGRTRGFYLAGPGYLPSSGDAGTGSSYGGEGATNDVTYGSLLNPLAYGSSGRGDNTYYSGGGLIFLTVAGNTTLNGGIYAKGFGYAVSGRGASTGGSVNLTTAALLGSGAISVDGGTDTYYGSGSGGRIRVKLTDNAASFGNFTGTLTAYGNAGTPGSAAGTITCQTAADGALSGTVIVDNNQYSDSTNTPSRAMCTHLPPKQDTDSSFAETSWVMRRYASLRITKNVIVKSLRVESTTSRIFLDGNTVMTKELVVNGVTAKVGSYTAVDYPSILNGSGSVVVQSLGTVLMVR